jgi:hypothetical protein
VFERLSPHARKVVVLAREQAGQPPHDDIGTEHLPLGSVYKKRGLARRILLEFNADPKTVRRTVILMSPESEG